MANRKSTDGFLPYRNAIRDAFGSRASHGVIVKTYSVTNLAVKDAARRYSPAKVVAIERQAVSGVPAHISTSYVERQNLTLRRSQRRLGRLTNAFSKKLTHHTAAVSLYVATTICAAFMRRCAPRRALPLALLIGSGQ